jgi:hypothetical protein
MKVLWLGNSDDAGNPTGGSMAIARRLLEQHRGEDVELTARVIWPSDDLPEIIGRWLQRYEPDVVMSKLDGYWYLHNSLPLRIEQALGRWGGTSVRAWGERAVRHDWFRHSWPYRGFRALAKRSLGTATNFSPQYVAGVTERCVRRIVAREGTGLTVWGQTGPWPGAPAGAQAYMYGRISKLCAQLHVSFVAWDPASPAPGPRGFQLEDGIHRNDDGHEFFALREAHSLRLAYESSQDGTPLRAFDFETNEVRA